MAPCTGLLFDTGGGSGATIQTGYLRENAAPEPPMPGNQRPRQRLSPAAFNKGDPE
jgi:hypothetical protein